MPSTPALRSPQAVSHSATRATVHQGPSPQISKRDAPAEQATKDPKSFAQTLFDTLPFRLLELMPGFATRSEDSYKAPLAQTTASGARNGQSSEILPNQQVNSSHQYATEAEVELAGEEGRLVHDMVTPPTAAAEGLLNGHIKMPLESAPPLLAKLKETNATEKVEMTQHESLEMLEGSRAKIGPGILTLISPSLPVFAEFRNLRIQARQGAVPEPNDADFMRQSLFYCVKEPTRLSEIFRSPEGWEIDKWTGLAVVSDSALIPCPSSGLVRLGIDNVRTVFGSMSSSRPHPEILRNTSLAIRTLYIPARQLRAAAHQSSSQKKTEKAITATGQAVQIPEERVSPLSDWAAARVCVIGLHALADFAVENSEGGSFTLPRLFNQTRASGRVMLLEEDIEESLMHSEGLSLMDYFPSGDIVMVQTSYVLGFTDKFDDTLALDLLESIVGVVVNRWTHWEISKARNRSAQLGAKSTGRTPNIMQMIIRYMEDDAAQRRQASRTPDGLIFQSGLLSRLTICWLKTLMLRDWDGRPTMQRVSTVGSILQILGAMYENRSGIHLEPKDFWTPVFERRFDTFDMPVEWLSFRPDNKTIHLLSYSFLFPPATIVSYFRAVNYASMNRSLERGILLRKSLQNFVWSNIGLLPRARATRLEERLEGTMTRFFLLEIRRDDLVTDAINQIWRCRKRDVLKPLKVRMGSQEGELGVDVGGVQQDFFSTFFRQALSPGYGMFTVDEQSGMTWFHPGSLEPLYKFEAIGILMSLAVYNAVTLPVMFPITFYRKLLCLKVKKLEHISDGWPRRAKGMHDMLDFKDGNVSEWEIPYSFLYDAFDTKISVDMKKVGRGQAWHADPASKDAEAATVTNANREKYIKDYIFWLTDKSIRPQFEAFARGFYTCLDRTALSIFTAEALQSLVEGIQDIDVDALRSVTQYEGYEGGDRVIQWFWDIFGNWPHERKKLLWEFWTASDRVPVMGPQGMELSIQRNGSRQDWLPTSTTCFGTLLLPEYEDRGVLEERLRVSVEEGRGFGNE